MFENFTVPQSMQPTDPRFGAGPSLIPVDHLQKLAATGQKLLGTSHRKDTVKNLVRELQEGLQQYFELPPGYEVVLGNGGATFVWDMIGLGMVESTSAHFTCGEFSEKWQKAHAQIPWIKSKTIKANYGEGINPHEEEGCDVVCATLNETSTGVQLSHIPKMQDPNTLLSLDATSAAGQILIDMSKVDIYYFAPQKVFAAEGGLYLAFLSPKAIERALKIAADKSRYIPEVLKWQWAIENGRGQQTYNTPSVANIFLMNEQLKKMNQIGPKTIYAESSRKAQMMYRWAETKSYLSPFVKAEEFRSSTVITVDVDERYRVDELTARLRKLNVAIDIDGYRKLGRNQLRIAMFPNVTYENLEKLTRIISMAIEGA